MSSTDGPSTWLSTVSRVTGVERRLDWLPARAKPYAVLSIVVGVDLLINLLLYLGGQPSVISPAWAVIPIGLTYGLFGTLDLATRYRSSFGADELPEWFRPAVLVGVLAGFYVFWLLQPAYLGSFFAERGPVAGSVQLFVIGPLYMAVVADFVGRVVGVSLLVPIHVARGRITIDFSDPTGYAGLRPLGRLVERASVYYFIGVILYSIRLLQQPGTLLFDLPGGLRFTLFALMWLGGVALYAIPTVSLRFLVERYRQDRLQALNRRIEELGEDDAGLVDTEPGEASLECVHCELAIQRVRSSRTVPVPSTQFAVTAGVALAMRGLSYLVDLVALG